MKTSKVIDRLTRWIEKLRSGKFKQANGQLKVVVQGKVGKEEHCCLGVACEMRAEELGCSFGATVQTKPYNGGIAPASPWRGHGGAGTNIGGSGNMLSKNMLDYLGINHDAQSRLASFNDRGKTFAQIADYIEVNILTPKRQGKPIKTPLEIVEAKRK